MLLRKSPKDKIKEVVEILDLESIPNKNRIKNMIKNNETISAFSKHLPKK